jgi:protein TonB
MPEETNKTNLAEIRPIITPVDRFGLALCLAIISHAIVVLGITFAREDILPPRYDAMDIILVQESSEPPDEAKRLAQASLEGGGDTDDDVTPATPLPSPFPDNVAELTMPPSTQAREQTKPDPGQALLTSTTGSTEVATSLTNSRTNDPVESSEKIEEPQPRKELPTATALLTNSMKMAALSAEIERKLEMRAQRPKRKYISASTQEFIYAAYMEAWRAKVERFGNLNYPDAARRQSLSGSLILDVSLNNDGSINDIIVRKSSGHKILDDASIRIVNLAAPFASFPDNIRSEVDILHITRTWQFINNQGFR